MKEIELMDIQIYKIISDADGFERKNTVHAQSIELNGHFLLCQHRPFCNQPRFTP